MRDPDDLLSFLRRAPLSDAAALMRALGLGSQATLSRLVTRAGRQVVPVGRARARRYAAARDVRGLGLQVPLYRVDAHGTLAQVATLRPFAPAGCSVEAADALPRWMRGHRRDAVFDGLPVFLADARPQGFLGRGFARRHALLGLADDPDEWSDDDVIFALAVAGDDMIGDLVLGEASARNLYATWAAAPRIVTPDERGGAYPALAEAAIGGVLPGSSAGGEQPKFGAIVGTASAPEHVLVKFSPAEDSASGQRWRDLLICEVLAHETIRRHRFPAVRAEIVESGRRLYLETARFDRVGARGRRPVVTLAGMNAEYVGAAPSAGRWTDAVDRLLSDRWVTPATAAEVRDLQTFGEFIANTDMHFGNVSFHPEPSGQLTLAPVYDMLPMAYAPVSNELPLRNFRVPVPRPGHEAVWFRAAERGAEYWRLAAGDLRISVPFREIARANAVAIDEAAARFAQGRPGNSPA